MAVTAYLIEVKSLLSNLWIKMWISKTSSGEFSAKDFTGGVIDSTFYDHSTFYMDRWQAKAENI